MTSPSDRRSKRKRRETEEDELEQPRAKAARFLKSRPLRMRFKDGQSLSYYAYLTYSEQKTKKNTAIGVCQDAIEEVYKTNTAKPARTRTRAPRKKKTEKQVSQPDQQQWHLEQIIGPFDAEEEAIMFRDHWAKNSRALRGRAKKGRDLAEANNLACWDMHYTQNYDGQ